LFWFLFGSAKYNLAISHNVDKSYGLFVAVKQQNAVLQLVVQTRDTLGPLLNAFIMKEVGYLNKHFLTTYEATKIYKFLNKTIQVI